METNTLFDLGECTVTQTLVSVFPDEFKMNKVCASILARHQSGDYGIVKADGIAENATAIANLDGRVFSSYKFENITEKIFVITDFFDKSSKTTLMLATDY